MSTDSASVRRISDEYVRDWAAAHPVEATYIGVPGHDDEMTDYSPEGHAARAELARSALRAVRAADAADPDEAVAAAVFSERIGVQLEIHDAGLDEAALNVLASPVQDIRSVFDLMPTATAQDWEVIARRLARVPDGLAGLRESLRAAAAAGNAPALRQVRRVAEQCDTWSGTAACAADQEGASFFDTLVAGAAVAGETLQGELRTAAAAAASAYADTARFLREELAGPAPERDAAGEDRYRLWSRYFLGAQIDLAEAYEWGWGEFLRLETEMREVAGRIAPGASPAQAAAVLDADPRYQVTGQDGLRRWMQELSDRALADLSGSQFDIPAPLMQLECRIAPPGGGVGAYYTAPSADFSRPGRMWWAVPSGRATFPTWREVTTVYHEGVPGHHLQVGTAVQVADRLNDFQRLLCWVSGHGEGWALYAERLMRELGHLGDDGDLLGMLDAQLFRAARVVVDIGMHLELPIPAGTGFHEGEKWTPELGLEFLLTRTITDPAHVRDEVDRYLGWPGQAPSYKLGERLWLGAREDAQRRRGAEFDFAKFHRSALELGSMGLDTLSERLATL
ncbi:MAG TPA: DUF885 domain-containing protein [Pseudonocardiaceae bacterium]